MCGDFSKSSRAPENRFVWIPFLVVSFLFSVVFMGFGVFMEGMRHSRPGPDQFDPYYLECSIPAVFFRIMLLVSLTRLPLLASIISSAFAVIAAVTWLAYEFRQASGEFGFPTLSAVIMMVAALAAWRVRSNKQEVKHATT